MIPPLNEIVDLPQAVPAEQLSRASEERFQTLLQRALLGDVDAQRELIRLRVAYLNWAYARRGAH